MPFTPSPTPPPCCVPPRSELIAEKKVLEDATCATSDLQETMRTVMKQLVRCAVTPSPVHRYCSLGELERGLSQLYHVIVTRQAEEKVGIADKQGQRHVLPE